MMENTHPAYQQKTDQLTVPHCLELLVHACQCPSGDNNTTPCQLRDCKQMKDAVSHVKSCTLRSSSASGGNCSICENLVFLCSNHTRDHRGTACSTAVPAHCGDKMNYQRLQQQRDQHQGYNAAAAAADAAAAAAMTYTNSASGVERARNERVTQVGSVCVGAAGVQQAMYQPQTVQQSHLTVRTLPINQHQHQSTMHLPSSQNIPEPPVNISSLDQQADLNALCYSEKFLQTLPPHRYAVFKRLRDRMDMLRNRQVPILSSSQIVHSQPQQTWNVQPRLEPCQVPMPQKLPEQPSNPSSVGQLSPNACYPPENAQQTSSPRQTVRLKRLRDRMDAYRKLQELRKQQYIQRVNNTSSSSQQTLPNKQLRPSNAKQKKKPSKSESSVKDKKTEPSPPFVFDSLIEPCKVKEESLVDLIAFDLDSLLGPSLVEQQSHQEATSIPFNFNAERNTSQQRQVDAVPSNLGNQEWSNTIIKQELDAFERSPNASTSQQEALRMQQQIAQPIASNLHLLQQHAVPSIKQEFDQDILDDLDEILQMLPEDATFH